MVVPHPNLSVTIVTRNSGQRGPRSNRPGLPLYAHFLCCWCYQFFLCHIDFCLHYFKVITICDKYKRYWNKGMYLPNQVNENNVSGPKRPQVPGLGLIHADNVYTHVWNKCLFLNLLPIYFNVISTTTCNYVPEVYHIDSNQSMAKHLQGKPVTKAETEKTELWYDSRRVRSTTAIIQ